METLKLSIRSLDGSSYEVEVSPSTEVAHLRGMLKLRFDITEFHDIELLLGDEILSKGSVAQVGLSDQVEVQMVKVLNLKKVIDTIYDYRDQQHRMIFSADLRPMSPRFWQNYMCAVELLRGVENLSMDYSARLFESITQIFDAIGMLGDDSYFDWHGERFQTLCDTFVMSCSDPDYWNNIIQERWSDAPKRTDDVERFCSLIYARTKESENDHPSADKEDTLDGDEKCVSYHSSFDEECRTPFDDVISNREDPSESSHQEKNVLSFVGNDSVARSSLASADPKEDLVKAIEASEADALEQEQTDVFKAIMESSADANEKARSAPSRLQHDTSSSLLDIPVASDITPEYWDDRSILWEFPDIATLTVAENVREESRSSFPPGIFTPPGIFNPQITGTGCDSISNPSNSQIPYYSNTCFGPVSIGNIANVGHDDRFASSVSRGSSEAQAPHGTEQILAGQGSKKTRNRNRRRREQEKTRTNANNHELALAVTNEVAPQFGLHL